MVAYFKNPVRMQGGFGFDIVNLLDQKAVVGGGRAPVVGGWSPAMV